jgi:hypothetical protein
MYTMQENTSIIETNFRSHPFAINHIWNYDVNFEVGVLLSSFFVERHKGNAKVTR